MELKAFNLTYTEQLGNLQQLDEPCRMLIFQLQLDCLDWIPRIFYTQFSHHSQFLGKITSSFMLKYMLSHH